MSAQTFYNKSLKSYNKKAKVVLVGGVEAKD